jgi:putative DNA primase/helicase
MYEEEQAKLFKPEIDRYKAAMRSWKAKCTGLEKAIEAAAKAGNSTCEFDERLERLQKEEPQPPLVPQLMYEDATPEALAWHLYTGWHSGALLSDEGGIVFGSHGMNKDSVMRNISLYNKLWDGKGVKIKRKTSESFNLHGARLTIGIAVQPDTLKEFFVTAKGLARGTGFLARCLIAWPESTQGTRLHASAPQTWEHKKALAAGLYGLLNIRPNMTEKGELILPVIDLSPEAKLAWIGFHDRIEKQLAPGAGLTEVRDVASKAADNAARIAALFHLYENSHLYAKGQKSEISKDHLAKAVVIAEWHLYEARRFFGEISNPHSISNAEKLEEWLLRCCRKNETDRVPARKVQREGPSSLRKKSELNEAVKELTEAGRARLIVDGKQRLIQVRPELLRGDDGVT